MNGDQITDSELQTLTYLKLKCDWADQIIAQMQEAIMARNAFNAFYTGIREKHGMVDGDTMTDAQINRVARPTEVPTSIEARRNGASPVAAGVE